MQRKHNWVFWQIVPSPHMAAFFRELARRLGPDAGVICVFEQPLPKHRLDLGWALPDYGDVDVIVAPGEAELTRLTTLKSAPGLHFFSGLISSAWLREVFARVESTAAFLGIITEDRDGRGVKGFLRRMHSLWIERQWRGRIDVAFAMGSKGVRWLLSVGYRQPILFPFGYVVEMPPALRAKPVGREHVHFVFVGRLDQNKNAALLIDAFARPDFGQCALTIIGDGPERSTLEKQVEATIPSRNVVFRGVLQNTVVREVIEQADCLVLPTKYDGWGAVVNEAMLAGSRVIVSDRCGAADVVVSGDNGFVFKGEDVNSLAGAMIRIKDMGPIDTAMRKDLVSASKVLLPACLADYFIDAVRYVQSGHKGLRPRPPWGRAREQHGVGRDPLRK